MISPRNQTELFFGDEPPNLGCCNHGFKGVTCPVGVADLPAQTDVLPPR